MLLYESCQSIPAIASGKYICASFGGTIGNANFIRLIIKSFNKIIAKIIIINKIITLYIDLDKISIAISFLLHSTIL